MLELTVLDPDAVREWLPAADVLQDRGARGPADGGLDLEVPEQDRHTLSSKSGTVRLPWKMFLLGCEVVMVVRSGPAPRNCMGLLNLRRSLPAVSPIRNRPGGK
jgi:hypothetical protein